MGELIKIVLSSGIVYENEQICVCIFPVYHVILLLTCYVIVLPCCSKKSPLSYHVTVHFVHFIVHLYTLLYTLYTLPHHFTVHYTLYTFAYTFAYNLFTSPYHFTVSFYRTLSRTLCTLLRTPCTLPRSSHIFPGNSFSSFWGSNLDFISKLAKMTF